MVGWTGEAVIFRRRTLPRARTRRSKQEEIYEGQVCSPAVSVSGVDSDSLLGQFGGTVAEYCTTHPTAEVCN